MKKNILYLFFIAAGCAFVIMLINSISDDHNLNGFNRVYIKPKVKLENSVSYPVRSFNFVGIIDTNLILNIYADQLNLYKTSFFLGGLDTIKNRYADSFNSKSFNIYKDVLLKSIYATNPYGDISISDEKGVKFYKIKGFRFDFFQAISPNTIIVRARFKYKEQDNRCLAKLTLSHGVVIANQYQLPKLNNGLFVNDGILRYDKTSSTLLYMYFYRGEFIRLDTNLNLMYKAKTIDTVRTARIKTAVITALNKDNKTTKRITQSTPPKFVNTYFATNHEKVYILSRLKADNENPDEYSKNQVIDVYNIKSGKYIHSFYLPKYNSINLNTFQFKDNTLYAIYGHSLVRYNFIE